jgi:hypothetical protein
MYVQTHEQHDNRMGVRTTGAIALRPTVNAQGSHHFMSLATGHRLARNNWTVLLMLQDVVERLQDIAPREQRSLADCQRTGAGITFLDRHQVAFPDDNEDMLMAGVGVIDGQIAGVNGYDDDEAYYGYEQQYDMAINHEPIVEPHNEPPMDEPHDEPPIEEPPVDEPLINEPPVEDLPINMVEAPDEPYEPAKAPPLAHDKAQEAINVAMGNEYGPRTREGLRPRKWANHRQVKGRDQGHLNVTQGRDQEDLCAPNGVAPVGVSVGKLPGDRTANSNHGTIIV